MKALRTAVYGLSFLVGLALFAVLVLTGTEGGTAFLLRTALDRVATASTLRIELGDIEGTLFSGIAIRRFNLRDTASGVRVNAEFLGVTPDILALLEGRVHLSRVEARGLALTLPAENPGAEPADPVAVLNTLFSLPVSIDIDDLAVTTFTLTGEVPVNLQSVTGELQWNNARIHVAARVVRDGNTWAAPDLTLNAGDFRVTAAMPWQARLGGQDAAGNLRATGSLYNLDVSHALTAPLAVQTSGNLDTGLRAGDTFGFDLAHQVANVGGAPFGIGALENIAGTVTTTGTPARIRLNADADVRVTGLDNTAMTLAAVYEDSGLSIDTLSLRNARFTFSATGNADFAGATSFSLSWNLADFNDGDLWPQVELTGVNGNGAVTVTTAGAETVTELSLETLAGNLNGYPLSGNGEIAMTGSAVENVALTLVSDVNSLLLEGSITPALDLMWELKAPALTQLLDGLTGEIIGSGTLTGATEAPQVAGRLDATGLSYRSGDTALEVGSLSAQARYSGSSNAVTLTYSAISGRIAGIDLVQDSGVLELTGAPVDHAFSLSTQGPEYSMMVEGVGAYANSGWNGTLPSLAIASPYGNWALEDDLALSLSPEIANIGNHCWRMGGIMVCGQAQWGKDAGLSGDLAIDNLPLAWLNDNLPAGVPGTESLREQLAARPQGLVNLMDAYRLALPENGLIEGMLDLDVSFSGVGPDWRDATLSAALAPRDVSLGILREPGADAVNEDYQVERYGIDDVALAVERSAARWRLQSSFGIYLGEAGGLDFQGNFDGNFHLADDSTLGGDFALTFNNIAWVEALAPNLSQVSGELGASGNITGTLDRPLLNMDARLDNGSFRLPEFGLALQAVNLELNSADNNQITITGSARSGDGNISLDSLLTTPLLESRTLHVTVSGSAFELLNTEETRMTVAPDLTLDYRDQVLNVSGSLDVPMMHIDFSDRQVDTGGATVDVSRDVVIVADDGSQPVAGSSGLLGMIPVTGEVRLGMGGDVTFQGYGLDLELTGNLRLEQSIDRPLLAHGELSIPNGSYELYGQRLTINDGKLLFLGNPFNPALDIRAVRTTRVAEVGLLMNGTARNINAQLFSTPALPESEILSLLLTGNSFDSGAAGEQSGENMLGAIALLGLEKGQGLTSTVANKLGIDSVAINQGSSDYRDSSLGLGKYLRPNLFMRYDIGLFDRENVLSLDYILTERLKLEVESGVSQSVDLTYTVEK